MILLSLLASALLGQAAPTGCVQPDAAMLALPLQEFDQTPAGWRSLDAEGCEAVGAEAIARYREVNRDMLANEDIGTLIWHEGQLRAAAGQTDEAITLMLEGRNGESEATQPYVDATVAFLRRDREALLAARERLLDLPVPDYFAVAAERYRVNYPDLPPLVWPLNLDKVDGFIACFDRPYRDAYNCDPEGNAP
ncbi:MAG: hypothetical protein ACK4JY_13850 [Brevundimonas sp.]|uniref:hypothetical protein n=1 Tax=Brevundimonas sp. TaxID=1871086 RepID=UPI00391AD5E1